MAVNYGDRGQPETVFDQAAVDRAKRILKERQRMNWGSHEEALRAIFDEQMKTTPTAFFDVGDYNSVIYRPTEAPVIDLVCIDGVYQVPK